MATVVHPGPGRVTASFAGVAKHYGVSVAICPPRRGNRKGVVEKANHTAAQRWWRTLADDVTAEQAQAGCWTAVRPVAATPGCAPPPTGRLLGGHLAATRAVAPGCRRCRSRRSCRSRAPRRAQALVSFRGNRYSVPPELAARRRGRSATRLGGRPRHRHRQPGSSSPGTALAADGLGVMVRDHGHVIALEPRRWPRPAPAARTAASSASHPAPRPLPPPQRCRLRDRHRRAGHEPPPGNRCQLSSTCPPTRRPPRKQHPAMTTPPSTPKTTTSATGRRRTPGQPLPAAPLATSPSSNCTTPPRHCPPSWTSHRREPDH